MICGNDPTVRLTDGDTAWIDWFRLYLRWAKLPAGERGPAPATPDGSDPITGQPAGDDQDQAPAVEALAGRYRWYDAGAGPAAGGELVDRGGCGPYDDGTVVAQGITLDAACQKVAPHWVRAIPQQLGRPLPTTRRPGPPRI